MFRSEASYRLDRYKEFTQGYARWSPSNLIIHTLFILALLVNYLFVYRFLRTVSLYANSMLLICAIYLLLQLLQWLRSRNGDMQYRQMLQSNGGQPISNTVTFTETCIHSVSNPSGESVNYTYDQVRHIFETRNLLVLVLDLQLCVIVDKDTLTGGSVGALKQFLLDNCLDLKRRKIRGCALGIWLRRVQLLAVALTFLLALASQPAVQQYMNSRRAINSNMNYTQIAEALEALGITGSDDAALQMLESDFAQYGQDYGPNFSKVMDLMGYLGMGVYDQETWQWTPAQNGVYWFSLNAHDPQTMYTDFLRGVSALDSAFLAFSDIQEDTSQVDWESGTGNRSVTFTWEGRSYTFTGVVMEEWFDLQIADELNRTLRLQGDGRQLYFAPDQWHGCFVFFRDRAWALEFQEKTGITLYTEASDI